MANKQHHAKSQLGKKIINILQNFTLWETIDRIVNLFFIVELIIYFNLYETKHDNLWFWLFWGHVVVFFMWDVVFIQIKRKVFNFIFKFVGNKIFKKDPSRLDKLLMTTSEKQAVKINQLEKQQTKQNDLDSLKQEIKVVKHQIKKMTKLQQQTDKSSKSHK